MSMPQLNTAAVHLILILRGGSIVGIAQHPHSHPLFTAHKCCTYCLPSGSRVGGVENI